MTARRNQRNMYTISPRFSVGGAARAVPHRRSDRPPVRAVTTGGGGAEKIASLGSGDGRVGVSFRVRASASLKSKNVRAVMMQD